MLSLLILIELSTDALVVDGMAVIITSPSGVDDPGNYFAEETFMHWALMLKSVVISQELPTRTIRSRT